MNTNLRMPLCLVVAFTAAFIDAIIFPAGDGLLEVRGDLGRMLRTAAGEQEGSILAAVVESGCGGPQPTYPTHLTIPTALYVVAA